MIIEDRIYGPVEIKSGVIFDLVNSSPFQRLKKISQDGASHFIQPVRDINRYEHSIGVWHLSRIYNRSIEEQIASLLHDIPHTAFSHVIDYVVEDEHQGFHDKFTEKIILNSEIPNILEEHGIKIKKVLNKESFEILDNNLPDISFDRLDYFMRDGYMMGFLAKDLVEVFLDDLRIVEEKFVFTQTRIAATFAILFVNFCRLIWLDPTSHGAYFLLANAIKQGMKLGHITEEDFFLDDEKLYEKLIASKDRTIIELLDRLKPGKEFIYTKKEDAEFFGPNKPRYVNPLVKTDSGVKRVSELVPSLKYFFEEFSEKHKYLGVKQIS